MVGLFDRIKSAAQSFGAVVGLTGSPADAPNYIPPTAEEEARFAASQQFQDDIAKGGVTKNRLWIKDKTFGVRYMTPAETEKEWQERGMRAEQLQQDRLAGKTSNREVIDDPEFGNRYATDNEVKKDLQVRIDAADRFDLKFNPLKPMFGMFDSLIGRPRNVLTAENNETAGRMDAEREVNKILEEQAAAERAKRDESRRQAEQERDRLKAAGYDPNKNGPVVSSAAATAGNGAPEEGTIGAGNGTAGLTKAELDELSRQARDMIRNRGAAVEGAAAEPAPIPMTGTVIATRADVEASRADSDRSPRAPESPPEIPPAVKEAVVEDVLATQVTSLADFRAQTEQALRPKGKTI